MNEQSTDMQAVAIVGMSVRLPIGATLDEVWRNLCAGVEGISALDEADLSLAGIDARDYLDPRYVKREGTLRGIDEFDAPFFGYSGRQAAMADPQQRLLLECSWEALEEAGWDAAQSSASVGVFVGASRSSYENLLRTLRLDDDMARFEGRISTDATLLATLISYKLNLDGPSFVVGTACSSSLVGAHLACQSLLNQECDVALVCGISIHAQPTGYRYQEGGILSADGHCRAFDETATGTIPGSGAVVLVLKRLADALDSGCHVHAVIKGSAINNDGAAKIGYTAPSVSGQASVVATAQAVADTPANTIGFVEAHGTGTVLGDRVEIEALSEVFGSEGRAQPCVIGSLKSNVGHLDAAAGLAGLVKAVLCLKHRAFVPSLHFKSPIPELRSRQLFRVCTGHEFWPEAAGYPRRAGVSAFGIGGTNAHLIVEEFIEAPVAGDPVREPHLLVFSARSPRALQRRVDDLASALTETPQMTLGDAAFTQQVGRRAFSCRAFIVCDGLQEAARTLASLRVDAITATDVDDRKVVLVCRDLGAGSDVELPLRDDGLFEAELLRCVDEVCCHAPYESSSLLFLARLDAVARACSHLAIQVAIGRRLAACGLRVAAIVGQGVGELSAACLCGYLPLEQAAGLLVELLQQSVELSSAPGPMSPLEMLTATIPCMSAATRGRLTHQDATAREHWLRALHGAGDLAAAVRAADADAGANALIVTSQLSVEGEIGSWKPAANAGATLRAMQSKGVDRAVLECLGVLWTAGVAIDWHKHHAAGQRRRLSLPTYPFERGRHWVEPVSSDAAESVIAVRERRSREQWLYIPTWTHTAWPSSRQLGVTADRCACILLNADAPLIAALEPTLSMANCDLVRVTHGVAFRVDDLGYCSVRPGNEQDLRALFTWLRTRGTRVLKVVLAVDDGVRDASGEGALPAVEKLLAVVKAHQAVNGSNPMDTIVLCSSPRHIADSIALGTAGAGAAVACAVIGQEHANLSSLVLDWPELTDSEETRWRQRYVAWTVQDILNSRGESVLRYRQGQRFVQEFTRISIEGATAATTSIRSSGVYVITGAFGRIGRALSRYLLDRHGCRLLLLGRASVEAAAGPAVHDTDERVLVKRIDVSDTQQVRAAVAEAEATLGPIRGLFHLAADTRHVSIQRPILDLTAADLRTQWLPKVGGLEALWDALADRPLDFAVVFSSNAAILGGLGRGAYGAANAAANAVVVAKQRTASFPWTAICWDGWVPSRAVTPAGKAAETDPYVIDYAEGIAATLEVIAGNPAPLIVVSACDLQSRLATWLHKMPGAWSGEEEDVAPVAPTRPGAPTTELEKTVAAIWREILDVDDIAVDDDFFDIGGDSLLALRVMAKIRELFDVNIPMGSFFIEPTVRSLIVEVVARLAKNSAAHAEVTNT